MSFDLYGCVQVAITPPADKDGKIEHGHFFDLNRIEVLDKKKVLPRPTFKAVERVEDFHGPAGIPNSKY